MKNVIHMKLLSKKFRAVTSHFNFLSLTKTDNTLIYIDKVTLFVF